ncbi:MAG: NAD-dependent epimerase/dehydratase family protein [Dongiaceae bacterium]
MQLRGIKSVLVTGASGFVGRELIPYLIEKNFAVTSVSRRLLDNKANQILIPAIAPDTAWAHHVAGIEAVVHLAARVHQMRDKAADPLSLYRQENRDSALNLARQAKAAGCRLFIFLSTAKVMGEESKRPFTEADIPEPTDPYAIAKFEAEQELLKLANADFQVMILRPPLIYGPEVRANFLSLLTLADKNWWLPFGALDNKRSLLYTGNLLDAIASVLRNPQGGTYFISDGRDLPFSELLRVLRQALGRRPRLLRFSPKLLKAGLGLIGKKAVAARILGDFQIDSGHFMQDYKWRPPYSVEEGLKRTIEWFQAQKR